MQARVHSARLAYYDAAQKLVNGSPFTMEASLAKMIGSDAAMANARDVRPLPSTNGCTDSMVKVNHAARAHDGAQIWGGYGFMNENAVGRHYRDAKILEIGEGTTEVQLMIIARELGLVS